MKRGTPSHPKMKRLATAMDISLGYAVGIVEGLFHFTAEMAPQGNVGKWSDDEIADGLGCSDIDGDALVAGLLAAGWLDEDPEHRLLVHDWSEHADRGVRMRVKNRGQCLLGAHKSETGAHNSGLGAQSEKERAQYKTTSTSTSETTSTSTEGAQQPSGEVSPAERWEAQPVFACLKPNVPSRLRPGPTAIVDAIAEKLRDGVDGQHIIDRAQAYYASPHSRGETPWRLKAFVRDGHYDDEPDAWQPHASKPADGAGRTPKYDTAARDKRLAEDARVIAERDQETTS